MSPCRISIPRTDSELIRDDLAPRRLVALPVRRRARHHLDLAGRQHPDGRMLPTARAVRQRAEDPRRRQAAHLGERRHPDAELHGIAVFAALGLLAPQPVVVEQLPRLGGGGLVVAGVVGQPRDGVEGELLVGDPVLRAQFERIARQLGGKLVHHPLDRERRLRTAGAAVGVGGHLVGEDVGTREAIRRELVDAVEHERAEDRDAGGDEP